MSNTFPSRAPQDSAGDDARATASTSSPQQERAQAPSDFLREGRPRPAYTMPLDMNAEMEALATLPSGAAREVARSQPTISRPAVMNGELGVFVPLSALHDRVGVAEPLNADAFDETGEPDAEPAYDGETPVMPEEWYETQVARQPVVSSGRWGVDSQDFTDSGSLDTGHMARRNAGKAWSRLLRLGQPATLRQRLGGVALTGVILVTALSLLTAFIFTVWSGGGAGWPPFSGPRLGGATSSNGASGSHQPIAPPAGSAAISFTLASQTVQPDASFALNGQSVSGSSTQSSGTIPSYWVRETEADAVPAGFALRITNNSGAPVSKSNWYPTVGSYSCMDPISFSNLPNGVSQDQPCAVSVNNPSANTTIPAHTLQGTVPGLSGVTFDQTVPLVGNGHYQVRQQDCATATQVAHNAGASWAQQWMSQQSLPSDQAWAYAGAQVSYSADSCPVNQYIASFQATTSVTARNVRYTPGTAVSQAASRLDVALPAGYAWKANSKTSCSPQLNGVSGATVMVACAVSGQAIFSWTDAMGEQLVAALSGKLATDAEAICNTTPGIAANSCHVQLGDGASVIPTEVGKIKLYPSNP